MPESYRQRPWGLPGGKNHEGETLEVTLTRELKEELDCDKDNFYFPRRAMTGKRSPVVFDRVDFKTRNKGTITIKGIEVIIRDPNLLKLDKRENTHMMWVSWDDLKNPEFEIGFDNISHFAGIVIRRLKAEGKFGPEQDL